MRPVLIALLLTIPLVAEAQGPYVGASVLTDVVRTSGSNDFNSGSGEAVGGAVRVGACLGTQWGVDLEFARSGGIDVDPSFPILTSQTGGFVGGVPAAPSARLVISPSFSGRQQLSTLTTTLFWRQDVGERFQLLYLGGVAFSRTVREFRLSFPPGFPTFPDGTDLRPPQLIENESVAYDAGVVVGLDGSVGMTEHLRLVPGLRLLNATPAGWVIRPGVGLHWMF